MTPLPPPATQRTPAWFVPLLVLLFLFLFIRNSGVYPIVFIDEWTYSSNTRLLPMSEALVPSYLYFWLYQLTSSCGDGFLDCNRMLNSLLFVLAAPFIYLLARRLAPAWLAALVAVAAVLSPSNTYTPYFMPEAMYFCAFWCLNWAVFEFRQRPGPARAAGLGALLGLMAMIKVHALFLAPALLAFIVYVAFEARAGGDRWRWARRAAALLAAASAATLATRYGIGYLLAGKAGLSLVGSLYQGQAAYTARAHYPLGMLIGLAWHNLQGHLMLLGLMFGVPLAVLASTLGGGRRDGDGAARALAVYTLLTLGALLGVTVLFTASITGLSVTDGAERIHTRYYAFALPMLLLCAAAAWRTPPAPRPLWRCLVGALLLLLIWHGRAHLLHSFTPGIIDSPELLGLSLNRRVFNVITGLAALSVLLWGAAPRCGLRLFLLLALPVGTLCCAKIMAGQIRLTIYPDHYSKAGLFARHYLERAESDQLVIVADDIGGLHRSRFFIENPNAEFMQVTPGQEVDWSKLPAGKQWVLVIGHYAPPPQARVVARKDFMMLFRPPAKSAVGQTLRFNQAPAGDYVQRVDGLAGPDTWGSWSVGPKVEIEFGVALPRQLTLQLRGRAFGPNAGREVLVSIGAQQQRLRLPTAGALATLRFDTDGAAKTIRFDIPQPTSERTLGLSQDSRPLGIGFESLLITDAAR